MEKLTKEQQEHIKALKTEIAGSEKEYESLKSILIEKIQIGNKLDKIIAMLEKLTNNPKVTGVLKGSDMELLIERAQNESSRRNV